MSAAISKDKTDSIQTTSREIPAARPPLTLEMLRASTIYVSSFTSRVTEYESVKSKYVGDSIPLIVGSVLFAGLSGAAFLTGHAASAIVIGAVSGIIYGPICLAFGISAYFDLKKAKRNDKLNNR